MPKDVSVAHCCPWYDMNGYVNSYTLELSQGRQKAGLCVFNTIMKTGCKPVWLSCSGRE
jgi:hypothetical protein